MKNFVFYISILAAFVFAMPAHSERLENGSYTVETQGDFEDVVFNLENAIVNRGFVVDYKGYINAMLERTAEVAESVTSKGDRSPYKEAVYMHFCSAALTHAAVSASPKNITMCPYVVFAYELNSNEGTITVGYRRPVSGPSKLTKKIVAKVEKLMTEIVKEATE